jgi:hypothetical protein
MSDYGHYVTYRQTSDQVRSRVERTQRTALPGLTRRPARRALAHRLHRLADRIDL